MEKQRVHFGQPRQDTPILFLSIVSNPSLPLPRPDKPMPKADTHNWPDRSPDIHKHGHPPRKQRHLTHVISPCALLGSPCSSLRRGLGCLGGNFFSGLGEVPWCHKYRK